MNLKIHTRGIKGSTARKDNEQADALFGAVLEIDGLLIERVSEITVHSGDTFTEVTAVLIPGEIEYVSHTQETWDTLQLPGWARPLA